MKKLRILYCFFFILWGTSLLANFSTEFYSPTKDFYFCYYDKFQNIDSEVLTKDFFNSILKDCKSNNKNDIAYTLQQCFYFDFLNRFSYNYQQNKDFAKAKNLTINQALTTCADLVTLYNQKAKKNDNLALEKMVRYSIAMAFDFIIK